MNGDCILRKQLLGLELLRVNFKSVFIFEIFYKVAAILLFVPLLLAASNFSLKLAGIKYLSNDNLFYFFTRPSTIVIIILFVLCLAFYLMFEIMSFLGCFHASYYNKKISALHIFRLGIYSVKKLFKGMNFLLVFIVILIFPLIRFIQGYVLLSNMKFPNFVANYLNKSETLALAVTVLIISIISIKLIYSLCYFCTENHNLKESIKKGLRLIEGNYIKTVLGLLIWNISIALAAVIILIIIMFFVVVSLKLFGIAETAHLITLQAYRWILILVSGLYTIFSTPISFAYICSYYYKERSKDGEILNFYKIPKLVLKRPVAAKISLMIFVAVLITSNIFIFVFQPNIFTPNIQLLQNTNVTAHRGDSINAPENTIAAFESAISHFADWIELDLRQTKDGVIVVIHDSSLKRTAGINKRVGELTYDEIKDLDVGTWFGKEYAGEKIPTLDEAIKHINGRAKLNIELKPTGYETDFEKEVVRIIKENKIEAQCVVSSLKYDTLRRVKKIAPEIKTIFVTGIAYGDLTYLEYADGFSIEQNFITKKLVNNIKNSEKDLYVWTVNNAADVQKMVEMGVDNIITDNPLKAKEAIYKKYAPDMLIDLFNQSLSYTREI